jgi:hypothetical protein
VPAPFLLVSESVLIPAIRALPGNPIAGHTPYVFLHARLADPETAAASPAERKFPAAAVAQLHTAFAMFLPVGGFGSWFIHGCCFIPLLV